MIRHLLAALLLPLALLAPVPAAAQIDQVLGAAETTPGEASAEAAQTIADT